MTTENLQTDALQIETSDTKHVDDSEAITAERQRGDALEGKLKEVAENLRSRLPESLQKLIPRGLSVSEQIDWINNAASSDLAKPRIVPRTDTTPPSIQQQKIDPSELPPVKRIAMSYGAAE